MPVRMASFGRFTVRTKLAVAESWLDPLSCAASVSGNDPVTVGVPERIPSVLRVSPAGSGPLATLQEMPAPPAAMRVVEYGVP